jgi:hypothetical protein
VGLFHIIRDAKSNSPEPECQKTSVWIELARPETADREGRKILEYTPCGGVTHPCEALTLKAFLQMRATVLLKRILAGEMKRFEKMTVSGGLELASE